jgi:AraC-like DNA-binding protein
MVRISTLIAGRAHIWSHGMGTVIEAGDTVVNPPGCTPRILRRLTDTSETLTAYIAPAVFDSIAQTRGVRGREIAVIVCPRPELRSALEDLEDALARERDRTTLQDALRSVVEGACSAARDIAARTLPGGPLRPEIARARAIIQERFDQMISLSTLADEVGLSKFHLLRLFREEVGATPHAYQLHLRIARARELLDARASAAEVALACGFADQAHFTRTFKRIVGFTPGRFRRFA